MGHFIEQQRKQKKDESLSQSASSLFLEEVAQMVQHATTIAATTVRRVLGGSAVAALAVLAVLALALVTLFILLVTIVLVLVLLHGIFSKAADESTADRSEEAVVGLVAGEATGSTAGESASKPTITLLGTTGSVLVMGSEKHVY